MNEDEVPRADQVPGAPHPRETRQLYGQNQAEQRFLAARDSGRLHHGWLLTGPRGVGKATLAWRIAAWLIANPPGRKAPGVAGTLDVDPNHPVARRIQAGSEPCLALVTRSPNDRGVLRQEIGIEDVRKLGGFFGLSAAEGGNRVVIVDAADEMNVNAANGLLKMLEEPPAHCTLLLVAHQPARLLPTIRSRCRVLRLVPLGQDDMRQAVVNAGSEMPDDAAGLTVLADGSVGTALRLLQHGGLGLYARIVALLASLPGLNRAEALELAEWVSRPRATDQMDLLLALLDIAMVRLARTGATGTPEEPEAVRGEAETFRRLAPDCRSARVWAEQAAEIVDRTRRGREVNIDPATLVLDALFKLQAAARVRPQLWDRPVS